MDPKFSLSSDDCELLLAFEKAKTIERLAGLISRDASAVSRRLQQLSSRAEVIEKVGNRWRLTSMGAQINRWTEEALSQQASALSKRTEIKFGASRMFAGKVIARHLDDFQEVLKPNLVSVVSLDGPLEPHLLNGTIDVGFTCGRPQDPAIAFKAVAPERYVAAASKEFLRRHKGKEIWGLPFLAFRNVAGQYPFAEIASKATNTTALFNDPISLFEAVCADAGWSVLPYFAVKTRPEKLVILPTIEIEAETYGVWWLRQRKSPECAVKFATEWLGKQQL